MWCIHIFDVEIFFKVQNIIGKAVWLYKPSHKVNVNASFFWYCIILIHDCKWFEIIYLNTLGQRYDDKGANKIACKERGKNTLYTNIIQHLYDNVQQLLKNPIVTYRYLDFIGLS